ncbi:MAG: hypothetical protein J7K23_06270 [Thermoproteales archaeon]|nr:hypothetical protein [Thermoproteales archaeon]
MKIFRRNLEIKVLSYTDATTIVVKDIYSMDYLLIYDIRSFQGLVDNIIGPNYWNTLTDRERKKILKYLKNISKKCIIIIYLLKQNS